VPSEFQQLTVYRLAVDLSDEIYETVARWPALARHSVGNQLIRSADSIGANIAEASGRYHAADRRRLLVIARGSLYETEHWMRRAEKRGLLPLRSSERLDEIARLLNGLIRRPVKSPAHLRTAHRAPSR
jgi:four helix bundle protein